MYKVVLFVFCFLFNFSGVFAKTVIVKNMHKEVLFLARVSDITFQMLRFAATVHGAYQELFRASYHVLKPGATSTYPFPYNHYLVAIPAKIAETAKEQKKIKLPEGIYACKIEDGGVEISFGDKGQGVVSNGDKNVASCEFFPLLIEGTVNFEIPENSVINDK